VKASLIRKITKCFSCSHSFKKTFVVLYTTCFSQSFHEADRALFSRGFHSQIRQPPVSRGDDVVCCDITLAFVTLDASARKDKPFTIVAC